MVMIHCQAQNLVFINGDWVFDSAPKSAAPTSTSFPQAASASPLSRFASPLSRFGGSQPGCLMDLPNGSGNPTCFKCRKCLVSSLFIRMHSCMHLVLLYARQFPSWMANFSSTFASILACKSFSISAGKILSWQQVHFKRVCCEQC